MADIQYTKAHLRRLVKQEKEVGNDSSAAFWQKKLDALTPPKKGKKA